MLCWMFDDSDEWSGWETHSSTSSCVNSKNGFPFTTAALLINIVGVPT